MVFLIYQINRPFGSGVYSATTGIILNNQMDSFMTFLNNDTDGDMWKFRAQTNDIGIGYSAYLTKPEPFKRPLSSISPAILLQDGNVYLVVAGSGGSVTGQAMITSVIEVIWWKLME